MPIKVVRHKRPRTTLGVWAFLPQPDDLRGVINPVELKHSELHLLLLVLDLLGLCHSRTVHLLRSPSPSTVRRRRCRRRFPVYLRTLPLSSRYSISLNDFCHYNVMASSILTGDRRCGTVRGKMTVLGKVPKPINLPSQRSENHGLDPNVEIVPKGTLTWGSRASVATPNAWASSTSSSPHADGNAHSLFSARPSSSGSDPRPSTSGSDKSHERNFKTWGQNSRPSSASGILASNQISLAVSRPQSAESRIGSSQLSRFAENSSESKVVWGSTTKSCGFTLSSGDFPTLGSEKNPELHIQQAGSSTQKERLEHPYGDVDVEADSKNVALWGTDSYPYVHGDIPSNMEKGQRDPQQGQPYQSVNMRPSQFDNQHGVDAPDGNWHRGWTAGCPFRPASCTGTYVNPQIPGLLPNPQPILRPVSSHDCYYPESRDMYFPHPAPDSYMVPSHQITPLRPRVHQNPRPSDGYHCSRSNFCSSIDREDPNMGSPPEADYQYDKKSNIDSKRFHISPIMVKEQVKSDQADEIRKGQYVVLLRQNYGGEDHIVHEKREQSALSKFPHLAESNQCEATLEQGDWRGNRGNGEASSIKPTHETGLSFEPVSDWDGHPSDDVHFTKSLEDSSGVTKESLMKKQLSGNVPIHDQQQYFLIKKDTSLMEKIEVLNNKAQIAEDHVEGGQVSSKDKVAAMKDVNLQAKIPEQNTCIVDTLDGNRTYHGIAQSASDKKGTSNEGTEKGREVVLQLSESQVLKGTKTGCLEDGKKACRQFQRKGHLMKSGVDYCAKSGFASQGGDELVQKTAGRNFAEIEIDNDNPTDSDVPDFPTSQDITRKQVAHNATNTEDGSLATTFSDSFNHHKIQRTKQKVIATQHSKHLEEEQEKEQNSNALTKLEELDRCTSHGFEQSLNGVTPTAKKFQQGQDYETEIALETFGVVDDAQKGYSGGNSGSATDCSLRLHNQSLYWDEGAYKTIDVSHKSSTYFQERKCTKYKHVGYRRKQSIIQEKNQDGQSFSFGAFGSPKSSGDDTVHHLTSDSVPKIEEPATQPKKNNNRNLKGVLKAEVPSSRSSMQSSAHKEESLEKSPVDISKTQSESVVDIKPDPDQSVIETFKNQCSRDELSTIHTEELPQETEHCARVSNQCKPQSSRGPTRNQQDIQTGDKLHGGEAVMWAPVRPQNKTIQSEYTTLNHNQSSDNSLGTDGHDMWNGTKAKRAEMERYVPKPAVKKQLHQNSHQNLTGINQALPGEEMAGPDFDATLSVKGESGSVSNNGKGNKPNRRGKMHASWRQRHSAGLPPVSQSSSNEGSISSDATRHLQLHQHQQSKHDSRAEVQLVDDELRGKKLHNNSGSAPNDTNGLQSGTYVEKKVSLALELKESGALGIETSKFCREQKTTHWQPKSHSHPHNSGHGRRGMGSQRVASQGRKFDKEFHSQGTGNYLENEDDNFSARSTGGVGKRNTQNQEANRELNVIKGLAEKQTIA
ncbi:hypothetical protein J5N97_008800 [Dioscorea zingiberensis]|uniref:BAT2 N-terminal domain-containing protein n=1 Tax=Dioscorea zingiberensis TaxID=325984 RepID=A0A9D5CYA6_9LILI|nr:hypothetical protein J5N97_008800 [Dioscorea zingiberensis]